ncbi:MAG TPA: winged helix-turn-helix domain-containing protein [Streptosporangiaceae bacterium]|jgi:DNA-binding transcriptional ArsR family regulator
MLDGETTVLRALGHPARQEILDALALGPATSAMLARAMDSNTGVLSYHLRELGKAGLIEHDAERSSGRAVYWKLASDDIRWDGPATAAQPGLARAAAQISLARVLRAVHTYLGRTDLAVDWHEAALFSRSSLRLTAAQLAELTAEYLAFVQRWSRRAADDPPPGVQPVRLAWFAFPDLPGTDPAQEAES